MIVFTDCFQGQIFAVGLTCECVRAQNHAASLQPISPPFSHEMSWQRQLVPLAGGAEPAEGTHLQPRCHMYFFWQAGRSVLALAAPKGVEVAESAAPELLIKLC